MCGLAGFLDLSGADSEGETRARVATMAGQLVRRGLDVGRGCNKGRWRAVYCS
jgi:hypothetical protein